MSPRKCDYLSVQYEPSLIAFYLTKAPKDAWALSMLGTKYRAFYVEEFLVPYATLVQMLFFLFFCSFRGLTVHNDFEYFIFTRPQEQAASTAEFSVLAVFCVALL